MMPIASLFSMVWKNASQTSKSAIAEMAKLKEAAIDTIQSKYSEGKTVITDTLVVTKEKVSDSVKNLYSKSKEKVVSAKNFIIAKCPLSVGIVGHLDASMGNQVAIEAEAFGIKGGGDVNLSSLKIASVEGSLKYSFGEGFKSEGAFDYAGKNDVYEVNQRIAVAAGVGGDVEHIGKYDKDGNEVMDSLSGGIGPVEVGVTNENNEKTTFLHVSLISAHAALLLGLKGGVDVVVEYKNK